MATIRVRANGSYLVEGDDVVLVDWNGNPYPLAKRPFALCRCGGSAKKPFCDGTHRKIEFHAEEAAVPDATVPGATVPGTGVSGPGGGTS